MCKLVSPNEDVLDMMTDISGSDLILGLQEIFRHSMIRT